MKIVFDKSKLEVIRHKPGRVRPRRGYVCQTRAGRAPRPARFPRKIVIISAISTDVFFSPSPRSFSTHAFVRTRDAVAFVFAQTNRVIRFGPSHTYTTIQVYNNMCTKFFFFGENRVESARIPSGRARLSCVRLRRFSAQSRRVRAH